MVSYRFIITYSGGTREVYPLGFSKGSYKWDEEQSLRFLRKKLSGNIILWNDYKNNRLDYDWILAFETAQSCEFFTLEIKKTCDLTEVTDYLGIFTCRDGEWDLDRCTYTVPVDVNDEYKCLIDSFETKINLYDVTKINNSFTWTGKLEFEFQLRISININYPTPNPLGTKMKSFLKRIYSCGDFLGEEGIPIYQSIIQEDGSCTCKNFTSRWDIYEFGFVKYYSFVFISAREKIIVPHGITPLPAENWEELVDESTFTYSVYVRYFDESGIYNYIGDGLPDSFILDFPTFDPVTCDFSTKTLDQIKSELGITGNYIKVLDAVFDGSCSDCCYTGVNAWVNTDVYSGVTVYNNSGFKSDRFRTLDGVLSYFADKCDSTYESTFFKNAINPVTGVANLYLSTELLFIQKSDFKRINSSQEATLLEMSFKELTEILRNGFNIYWRLENTESGYVIRFEHISYWIKIAGIDTTVSPYDEFTASTSKYSYNKDKLPEQEKWNMSEVGSSEDFTGVNIIYQGCFVKTGKIQEYTIPLITTDVSYFQQNIDSISDDGFVLMKKGIDDGSVIGAYTGVAGIGKLLSIANLQDKFFRHDRVLLQGNMNGQDETFLSVKKTRNIKDLKVRLCCEEFNSDNYVTIDIGGIEYQADVKGANYDISKNLLKLDLIF